MTTATVVSSANKANNIVRGILCTLPVNCLVPHPQAKSGNWHDFVRCNDKKYGDICHYTNKHGMFYIANPKRVAA